MKQTEGPLLLIIQLICVMASRIGTFHSLYIRLLNTRYLTWQGRLEIIKELH